MHSYSLELLLLEHLTGTTSPINSDLQNHLLKLIEKTCFFFVLKGFLISRIMKVGQCEMLLSVPEGTLSTIPHTYY